MAIPYRDKVTWCTTCGVLTHGASTCPECLKWWMENVPMALNPMVVDLSHHNYDDNGRTYNFEQAKKWGVRGVIYKATEGLSYKDPTYNLARTMAVKAGLLWGAYHYLKPGDAYKQAKFFVETAKPEPGTLMVLDFEDAGCSILLAESFMHSLEALIKKKGMLYTYDAFIKERLGSQVNDYLAKCRLWIAKYGTEPTCQATWDDYWLWQFTGDGQGPTPHNVPGLGEKIDINHFPGTYDDLVDQWSHGDLDPDVYAPTMKELTAWGQATLNLLGHANLLTDGAYGKVTKAAVAKYQLDNELTITNQLDTDTVISLLGEVVDWNKNRNH